MQDFSQVIQAQMKSAFIDWEIIHKNLHYALNVVEESGEHTPLEGSRVIA